MPFYERNGIMQPLPPRVWSPEFVDSNQARRRHDRSIFSLFSGQFGFWLPLSYLNGVIAKNAVYSGGVGAELLTNGDFSAGSTGWNTSVAAPATITFSGGQVAIEVITPQSQANIRQNVLTIGDTYRAAIEVISNPGGANLRYLFGTGNIVDVADTVGVQTADGIAVTDNGIRYQYSGADAGVLTLDNASCKKISDHDALLSNVTVGQIGFFGANEAVDLNGSSSYGRILNTGLDGMTDFTFMMLVKLDTMTDDDTLLFKNGEIDVFLNASGSIEATVYYNTTPAYTATPVGVLTTGAWYWVTVVMDSSDDTIYIYVNDTLANDAVTPGVGTRVSNTNPLYLWNDDGFANALDGLCDEVIGIENFVLPL